MSLLTLGILVTSEYPCFPKHTPCFPRSSCPLCLECTTSLPTWLLYLLKSDWSFKVHLIATFLSEAFHNPSSQTKKILVENLLSEYFMILFPEIQNVCTEKDKLPLWISQMVLKPTGDNDDGKSWHLLSAYYVLCTVLSTIHTAFIHLFS